MPRIPNAATSEVIARTSGTTEATIAPNANSRMMNVSGIVSRSESSRPSAISSLMSSLMNVLLMAWIARPGLAARAPSRIGRTGAIRGTTPRVVALDPADDPDRRPVGRDEAGLGGAENGSVSWSKVGVCTPSSGALAARSWATTPPTAVVNAGSLVAPGAPPMTTMTCSNGSLVPPALKTS